MFLKIRTFSPETKFILLKKKIMYLFEPLSITVMFVQHLQEGRPEIDIGWKAGDDFQTDKIIVYISNTELF